MSSIKLKFLLPIDKSRDFEIKINFIRPGVAVIPISIFKFFAITLISLILNSVSLSLMSVVRISVFFINKFCAFPYSLLDSLMLFKIFFKYGSTSRSNIFFISLGTPGIEKSHLFSFHLFSFSLFNLTIKPAALPILGFIGNAPSGIKDCLKRPCFNFSTNPLFCILFKNLRLVSSRVKSLTNFKFKALATASLVISSSVGPRPPLKIKISLRFNPSFITSAISSSLSLTVNI